jgi:hypothetical protein
VRVKPRTLADMARPGAIRRKRRCRACCEAETWPAARTVTRRPAGWPRLPSYQEEVPVSSLDRHGMCKDTAACLARQPRLFPEDGPGA